MDYKSKRWRRKRMRILRRDGFRCRECGRYGLAVDATTVHHAWPAEDFPELEWEDWNLISLCSGCHGAMHDRVSGALTDLGLSWRRRVSPPPPPPSLTPQGYQRAGLFPTAGKLDRGVNRNAEHDAGTWRARVAPANNAPARQDQREAIIWAGRL